MGKRRSGGREKGRRQPKIAKKNLETKRTSTNFFYSIIYKSDIPQRVVHGLDNSQNATKAVGAAVSVAQASPTVNMISCGSAPTGLTISVDASAGVASSSNGLAQGIEEVGNKESSTDTATANTSAWAVTD